MSVSFPPVHALSGALLAMLLLAGAAAAPWAQEPIVDANGREFSVFNNRLMDPPIMDAASREFSALSLPPDASPEDAISREFTTWRAAPLPAAEDAVAREFTVFNHMMLPQITGAVSREFTVYNDTLSVEVTDAVSREFSAYRPGLPAPIVDAHSREHAIWNLTYADAPLPEKAPRSFTLHPARPNPFTGLTKLTFGLPEETVVTLKVFDVTGRQVAAPLDQQVHRAGWHSVTVDGGIWDAGIYFYRLDAGDYRRTGKLVIRR